MIIIIPLRKGSRVFLAVLALVLTCLVQLAAAEFIPSGKLEIHYINVGQGGCTLIIGPDGTRILYDFGNVAGSIDIVPYLRDVVGLAPADGLQYTIVSHGDKDHYMGYKDIIEEGYEVLVANFKSGSSKKPSATMKDQWLIPAKKTTAGPATPVPVGLTISLGDGAEAIVVAANGKIYGEKRSIRVGNENDSSVALFIRYGNFHYILDGDLGSGKEACTEHTTTQKDFQARVANALIRNGFMTAARGVDVMHIAHHGSESSSSAAYYNLIKPEVGLINVGKKNKTYLHPRVDVVDKVLIGDQRASCVKAPPLKALFQTEDGEKGCSATGCTSFTGLAIGDIKLVTDGKREYVISGNNRVHGGAKEAIEGKKWRFRMDEFR